MLGHGAEGWLAKLDEPVRRRLLSDGRHYNGRELTELLRAVCRGRRAARACTRSARILSVHL
jgi:hypothetical protein